MSVTNNLQDYLQNMADTIRAKKGIVGTINAQNFSGEIASIPMGNPTKNVIFYDYDGTELYSYTKNQFLALSAMPAGPSTHTNLIFDSWNWTLQEAKDYVTRHDYCKIGAIYNTTDGAIYIKFCIDGENGVSQYTRTVAFGLNGTATIYWGDGTNNTITATDHTVKTQTSHTYSNIGRYEIKIVYSGTFNLPSNSGNSTLIVGYPSDIYELLIGLPSGSTLMNTWAGAFGNCSKLNKISLPNSFSLSGSAFKNCSSIQTVIFPRNTEHSGYSLFHTCLSLNNVIMNGNLETFSNSQYCFNYCVLLKELFLPDSLTNELVNYTAQNAQIEKIIFHKNIARIPSNLFSNRTSENIIIPKTVVSLEGSFATAYNIKTIEFETGRENALSVGQGTFQNCYLLEEIEFPLLSSFYSGCMSSCYNLKELTFNGFQNGIDYQNNGYTHIDKIVFKGNYTYIWNITLSPGDEKIIFDGNVSNVYRFAGGWGLKEVDFTHCSAVPSCSDTAILNMHSPNLRVIVPDVLYNDWIAAENWSTISTYIVKESER